MRELGYVEGQDYGFEVRYADGNVSRIPPQIEELVRLKPDIIVSGTTAGVIAAKKLSNTVPIVCADLTNPIEFGLAASYARADDKSRKFGVQPKGSKSSGMNAT